jgi:hypothetical protein
MAAYYSTLLALLNAPTARLTVALKPKGFSYRLIKGLFGGNLDEKREGRASRDIRHLREQRNGLRPQVQGTMAHSPTAQGPLYTVLDACH